MYVGIVAVSLFYTPFPYAAFKQKLKFTSVH